MSHGVFLTHTVLLRNLQTSVNRPSIILEPCIDVNSVWKLAGRNVLSRHSMLQHAYEAGDPSSQVHFFVDGSHDASRTQQSALWEPSLHWHM